MTQQDTMKGGLVKHTQVSDAVVTESPRAGVDLVTNSKDSVVSTNSGSVVTTQPFAGSTESVLTPPPLSPPPLDVYVELDQKVDGAEHEGIWARWEFGRQLLAEREANGGKQLPHGRLDEIAEAVGKSRSEVKQRLWFAEKYPSRKEVVTAVTTYRSWTEIRESLSGGAHVGSNSGDNEWYTPIGYIKAAVAVMGAIDLDPASTDVANEVVGAEVYFGEADDSLRRDWQGRVWMNPPYAQPAVGHFCNKLAEEFAEGRVTEACVLVNNATETHWFAALAEVATAICFPRGRVKFWHPEKVSAPLQGQAVVYLGPNIDAFRSEFLQFGFTVAF